MLRNTIICEIGQNHCGNMDMAKLLIGQAFLSGADMVKFQLYDSKALYGEKQKSELSKEQAIMLFEYGKRIGVEVFFSVFDKIRIAWCEEMGVSHYKISCAMADNRFLVNDVFKTRVPMMISSQKPRLWGGEVSLLYCVPKYPASLDDLMFSNVDFTKDFQGYSDHTIGLDACKIAMARGAIIIEKHFAANHSIGVDAKWSMTPSELKELRRWSQALSSALG